MKDELQVVLTKLLTDASNGVDFLAGQLPEVVEQLIRLEFIKGISIGVGTLLMLFVSAAIAIKSIRGEKEELEECEFARLMVFSAYVLGGCVMAGFSFISFYSAFKIYFAPKVFLLEYAAGLVK